jgi:hypothetical protein
MRLRRRSMHAPVRSTDMTRISSRLCALTLTLALLPSLAVAGKPFAFRGVPLGISIDEFRSEGYVRAVPLGSVTVCETDAQAASLGMVMRDPHSVSIACKWAHRTDSGWHTSQAVVDGAPSRDHVLRFAAMPGDDAPRLYRMSFVIDASLVGDFTDALSSRYGRSRVRHEHGFMRRIWENDTSSITLEAMGTASTARVIYRLKDHEAWLAHLADQWRVADASASAP